MADNQPNEYIQSVVQSFRDDFLEAKRLSSASGHSDSTRLVWYVAICGYVLMNGVEFLKPVLLVITPGRIAWLLVPWAITAVLSVIGHIAIVCATGKEDKYYMQKIASLNLFSCKMASGKADCAESLSIINDENPEIKTKRAAMDSANKWRRGLVQAAQSFLLISFVWSIIALLFSDCLLPKS